MSKISIIEEAAVARHLELTGEEMRLYMLIKFHTWKDTGICRKNLRQISMLHGINYTHTTERYKKLKKLKWCEDTKKGIRPTVNFDVPKTGTSDGEMFRKPEHECSENGNIEIPKTGTSDGEMFRKPEHPFIPYTEPFKEEPFPTTTTETEDVVVVGKTDGRKSQFSFDECLRYVELCEADGQTVRNRLGLATHLFETGESDALILARLYPEAVAAATPPSIEYNDDEYELPAPEPLNDETRASSLVILRGIARDTGAESLATLAWLYTPEDWAWLLAEVNR